MRNKRRHARPLTLAVVSCFALGCEGESPTGPGRMASDVTRGPPPPPISAPTQLPFHVRAHGVLLDQQMAPDFGPPLFGRSTFGGRCSEPSDLLLRFSIEGQATHLGHFTAFVEHCHRQDFQNGTFQIRDGLGLWTAANGDRLRSHHQGGSAPGGVGSDETHVFSGGTGRFRNAAGEAHAHAVCDRNTGACVVELRGWLSFAASDRGR